MNEIWIETNNKNSNPKTIIRFSNFGRITRKNGEIEFSKMITQVRIDGKEMKLCHAIAKYFIPKTDEDVKLHRDIIDHITHNPSEYNVNDVRNLRWATKAENNTFPEAMENRATAMKKVRQRPEYHEKLSESLKGRKLSEEHKRKISLSMKKARAKP